MLLAIHTKIVPWKVVKLKDKKEARINCLKYILNTLEYKRKDKKGNYKVSEKILIDGELEIERMENKLNK